MVSMRGIWIVFAFCLCASAAVTLPGDSGRGKEVFRSQNCIACHSVNGEGGKPAPDLGKSAGRGLTPSSMAGLMWNHAPAMWSAIEKQGIAKPQLTEQSAADLFAFFYAARYFDRPGDAGRGKQVFASKRCADCHGLSSPTSGSAAPPVSAWKAVGDPIALAAEMWNHAPQMLPEFARKGIPHPQITAQDLTDLRVYLQSLPQQRGREPQFSPASEGTGRDLYQAKGCAACHQGNLAPENRPARGIPSDLAAAMWNHAGQMSKNPVRLDYQEMRRLVGYLWSVQYFEERGNPGRGKQVFTKKNCAVCHNDPASGAPSLVGRTTPLYPFAMVDALWKHGPAMRSRIEEKKLPWPRFSGTEMADLTAFFSAGAR
jgi:mono/diheme cytochrome c family protein